MGENFSLTDEGCFSKNEGDFSKKEGDFRKNDGDFSNKWRANFSKNGDFSFILEIIRITGWMVGRGVIDRFNDQADGQADGW